MRRKRGHREARRARQCAVAEPQRQAACAQLLHLRLSRAWATWLCPSSFNKLPSSLFFNIIRHVRRRCQINSSEFQSSIRGSAASSTRPGESHDHFVMYLARACDCSTGQWSIYTYTSSSALTLAVKCETWIYVASGYERCEPHPSAAICLRVMSMFTIAGTGYKRTTQHLRARTVPSQLMIMQIRRGD